VIAGATKPEQILHNAEAATEWAPTIEEITEISAMFTDPT